MDKKSIDTIQRFLCEDAVHYDFSDDCIKDSEYKKKEGYDKYFAYRTQNASTRDPDSNSILLQEIYKVLWPEMINIDYMTSNGKITSDTMTSIQHTLGKYFSDTFPNEVIEYMKKNPRQRNVSAIMCKNMFEQFGSVKKALNNNKNLEHFISVYHTIGNYVPVPKGFNAARSGPGVSSSYDYWDLSLMKIKEVFDLKEDSEIRMNVAFHPISQLLHSEEKIQAIQNCLSWLNAYSSWNDFVEKNFFQDYVDKDGEVIPFCEGHSWNAGCNEVAEYDMFFENAWKRIETRSQRMIEKLNDIVGKDILTSL